MFKSVSPLYRLAVIASFLMLAVASVGRNAISANVTDEDFMPCFAQAAERLGLNEYLLKAIALHESKMNPNANNTENFDDSEDIGIMQVNSWWLKNELHKYGISREKLWNPCLNIHTGAWILAQEVQKHGYGWEAIGYYNARTGWKRERYIGMIKRSLTRVYAAYGIVNVDISNPSKPISMAPTKRAIWIERNNPWAITPGGTSTQTNKGAHATPRRIIVVSSENPQERG